jgi:hypothetical protein
MALLLIFQSLGPAFTAAADHTVSGGIKEGLLETKSSEFIHKTEIFSFEAMKNGGVSVSESVYGNTLTWPEGTELNVTE